MASINITSSICEERSIKKMDSANIIKQNQELIKTKEFQVWLINQPRDVIKHYCLCNNCVKRDTIRGYRYEYELGDNKDNELIADFVVNKYYKQERTTVPPPHIQPSAEQVQKFLVMYGSAEKYLKQLNITLDCKEYAEYMDNQCSLKDKSVRISNRRRFLCRGPGEHMSFS